MITVYGATGFTGGQAARYLAKKGVPLCVAGRNEAKLRALAAELGATYKVADAHDKAALDALAKGSKVVLSTAGPFSDYGSELVAACVANKVHYCDITGETPWAKDLIERHHAQAKADGTRIVPFCGYDSCPSDLGTWLIVNALKPRGETTRKVRGFHRGKGGFNGGTLATMQHLQKRWRDFLNPTLLSPGTTATPDFRGVEHSGNRWLAPFLMGAINTRVVRRSAMLLGYGDGFTYEEFWSAQNAVEAHIMRIVLALSNSSLGKLAVRFGPKPGEGPSEETMANGYFRAQFEGEGSKGTFVRAEVSGPGDPGNRVTTVFVCESALSLWQDPLTSEGGVITPAVAFGDTLVERCRRAGFELSVRISQ